MPCVVCGHWVYEVRVNEAIQDDDSGWCYFCHLACRYWLENLYTTIAYNGAEREALWTESSITEHDGDADGTVEHVSDGDVSEHVLRIRSTMNRFHSS